MRILYIEDEKSTAASVVAKLKQDGHEVIHAFGVVGTHPITILPRDSNDFDSGVVVANGAFDAAIVDYKTLGFFKGDEIVGYFSHILRKPCLGCSSESSFNDKMLDYGAVAAVAKHKLLSELPQLIAKLAEPLPDKLPLPKAMQRRR